MLLVRRLSLLAVPALFLSGCLSPSPPQDIRYFAPYSGPEALNAGAGSPAAAQMPAVRVRRVSAAQHLREMMVWRQSEVEYGFYSDRKWTEMPAAYLERAMEHELFAVHGFRHTESPLAPSLDLELLEFEEVLVSPTHGRAALKAYLVGENQEALLEQTFSARVQAESADPASVAKALGQALDKVVGQAADAVSAALRAGM